VVDEEYRSLGTRKLIEDYSADAAIVGEPTEMKVAIAHKGFVWIEIETKGRAAHGSVPEKGVDAIAHAAKIVSALDKLRRRLESRAHPLLGSPKIHTSMIEGGTDWSIIPDRCVLKLERRTLPAESTESVMEEIEEILRGIKRETDNFEATARNVYDMPPLETPSDEPIVQLLQETLVDTTGRSTSVVGVPYWTDGALLSRLASIPTCLYGPGDVGVAHSADEHVNVEDVLRSAQVYRGVVQKFCA
jgi:acetylornithine deacetylase